MQIIRQQKQLNSLAKATALGLAMGAIGCLPAGPSDAPKTDGVQIVATVNGIAISSFDVDLASRTRSGHGEMAPESRQAVIDTIVRQEIIRQKAIQLGLDKEPKIQPQLARIEAQRLAAQRGVLGEQYFKHEVMDKAVVSEEEAKAYFNDHYDAIATEYHVWQILYKGNDAAITALKLELDGGAPFEEVAAKQFPVLPEGAKTPWDLNYLHWNQIPPEWRDVLAKTDVGQITDVIHGAGKRAWILKLIEKRKNDVINFDAEKDSIMNYLRGKKIEDLRSTNIANLEKVAVVQYNKVPEDHPPVAP